jgi:hypothetical protein
MRSARAVAGLANDRRYSIVRLTLVAAVKMNSCAAVDTLNEMLATIPDDAVSAAVGSHASRRTGGLSTGRS